MKNEDADHDEGRDGTAPLHNCFVEVLRTKETLARLAKKDSPPDTGQDQRRDSTDPFHNCFVEVLKAKETLARLTRKDD